MGYPFIIFRENGAEVHVQATLIAHALPEFLVINISILYTLEVVMLH